MIAVAVVALGLAVELRWPGGRRLVRHRLGGADARAVDLRSVRVPAAVGWALAGAGAVALMVTVDRSHLLVAAAAALAGVTAVRLAIAGRTRQRAQARRRESVEAVSLLAAELRAGALAESALGSAAAELPVLAGPARAAAHGGDVVAALREAGAQPGAEVLLDLAAAWWVADRAGAPLAGVLTRLADRARDDLDLGAEVQAELSPARATARLMALLPAFGLALGSGLGGDPVQVLLGTTVGGLCLLAGTALACAGLLWIERIARGAEQ